MLMEALRELAEGAPQECIVALNCLGCCYDMSSALRLLATALEPGGQLVATFPGTASALPRGQAVFRRLTRYAAEQYIDCIPGWRNAAVTCYGNVLTAIASVAGLPSRSFNKWELGKQDERYPVIVGLSSTWQGAAGSGAVAPPGAV